jgi:2-amino-4-hydroxy-6-hydroxymethyldihydropteridine diphosphokinase
LRYCTGVATVYLGLGSNIGDRPAVLRAALDELSSLGEVVAVSSMYETEPWGDLDQPNFLNLCCLLRTPLEPELLVEQTQAIEQRLGRQPSRRWGPRLIDIDLLTYDDRQLNTPRLTLPHPRIAERSFVLVPLAELAPGLRIPGHVGSVTDLLGQLRDSGPPPRMVAATAGVEPTPAAPSGAAGRPAEAAPETPAADQPARTSRMR